ncbi:nuclear valosin-containing protein-like isoform X1 [Coccinella septempunctata]|uniref:nuclear valosin-containing protein-like isoform X1 n=2 Tax=Coccinella septempunctata TaxID=41139 RepID=UPI001D05EE7D|nr:nuclear valosin-containing protein-like isoform X1 [Coccinella septempunctata]
MAMVVNQKYTYLEENVDKTYVDIGLMADELQNTYREYSRRKRNAFRTSVEKAYSIVLRSCGLDDQNDATSKEEVDEAEKKHSKEDRSNDNLMNNQLVEMYTRSNPSIPKMNENELIDISSDDSKEETQLLDKSSNGPSTSIKLARTDHSNNSSNNFQEKCEKKTVIQGKKRGIDDKITVQVNKKKKTKPRDTIPTEVPHVTFKNIVGMERTINEIIRDTVPLRNRTLREYVGPKRRIGYLLYGPPGCGKTLLAHAIAGDFGYPLIKVAAPELVEGISGNSEKLIRDLFKKAVASAPCVLFIDDIDAITNNRLNAQKDMQKRIVSQINCCLDGLATNPLAEKVVLIGATTNPDSMDPALRRNGRFSREVRLGIPNEESRIAILKLHSSHLKFAPDFDWNPVGAVTPGYVGADLVDLVERATDISFDRFIGQHRNEILNLQNSVGEDENINGSAEKKESDKSETEIIVDDHPKEINKEKSNDVSEEENLVLVIEDGNSKQEEQNIPSSAVPKDLSDSEPTNTTVEIEKENCMVTEPSEYESIINWNHEDVSEIDTVLRNNDVPENLKKYLFITTADFLEAAKVIRPSSIREGLSSVPNICWDDVGSLKDIRSQLVVTLLGATQYKKQYEKLKLSIPAGVLLCGPPGCGKTLLAKALANDARINFISVKGPELLNMYVGESEKAVRMCFARAKNSAPCVVFFDEIDALCPKRSSSSQNDVSSRIVNQLLTEMDGVEDRKGVFLLAATNRPDVIDPAVLRPGRFDKILYVGLPSPTDRVEILKTITRNGPLLGSDVDLESIGKSEKLSGYTGADLSGLVQEASRIRFTRAFESNDLENFDAVLTSQDFEEAISEIKPSVSDKDMELYEEMKLLYTKTAKINEQMDLS